MLPVTISGKPYDLPQIFGELTVNQVKEMMLFPKLDEFRILSILTQLDYELLTNYDISQFSDGIVNHLDFINDFPNLNEVERSESIRIQGVFDKKFINVRAIPPDQLQTESYWQSRALKLLSSGAIENNSRMIDIVCRAVAIYIQPQLNEGRVNPNQVVELQNLLINSPCAEVYPWGTFFLKSWLIYSHKKPKNLNTNIQQTKSARESGSLQTSGTSG